MGVYDTYHDRAGSLSVQIKVDNDFDHYTVGQTCPLADGIYLGWEGAVVVEDRHVVMVTNKIWDKWANELDSGDLIRHTDPFAAIVREAEARYGQKEG